MGKHADYMALGYALMAILLFGMIAWTYYRFRMLHRESALIDQFEAEERTDRFAAAVGASGEKHLPQPHKATPGVGGKGAPESAEARTLPDA